MKSSTATVTTLLALLYAGAVRAHYPMLEVEGASPIQEVGKPFTLKLSYGHPFLGDRGPSKERPFVELSKLQQNPRDVSKLLKLRSPHWLLARTPRRSGDHAFGWQCGLFSEGQRRVSDYAKIVLHVRDEGGAQLGWDKTFGHPLEILPLTRPYAIPAGSVFRGRVVRHTHRLGKDKKPRRVQTPLGGAIVEAASAARVRGRSAYLPHHRLNVKTDPRGVFAVTLPRAGWWMIACATDGGPGEQGTTFVAQSRAVMWVHVGATIFDTKDPGLAFGRKVEKTRITIETSGTLQAVLRQVVQLARIPFRVEGLRTKTKVAVKVKDRPLPEVLDAIATQASGAWKRKGRRILFYAP